MADQNPIELDERLSRLGKQWFAEVRAKDREETAAARKTSRTSKGDGDAGDGGDGIWSWLFGESDGDGCDCGGDGD